VKNVWGFGLNGSVYEVKAGRKNKYNANLHPGRDSFSGLCVGIRTFHAGAGMRFNQLTQFFVFLFD
jgi:hypothetical protein